MICSQYGRHQKYLKVYHIRSLFYEKKKKQGEWDAADKLKVVKEYLTVHNSFVTLGRKYKLNESSIRKWAAKFQTFGENAFMIRSANLHYSAAFKEQAVKAYLHGEGPDKDIAIKYKIQAASTVLQWVKRYNNHEQLTDSRPEGVYRMVKNNTAKKQRRKKDFPS